MRPIGVQRSYAAIVGADPAHSHAGGDRSAVVRPFRVWAELLLALPEFILTDAWLEVYDELVAEVVLPRDVQPCTR